jgi:hypothetical protein
VLALAERLSSDCRVEVVLFSLPYQAGLPRPDIWNPMLETALSSIFSLTALVEVVELATALCMVPPRVAQAVVGRAAEIEK